MLTFEVIIVFLGLIGMVTALLLDKMRPGMILFSVTVFFLCFGILTPKEMLEGFSNKGMITVALLFLISEGVRQSGALGQLIKNTGGCDFCSYCQTMGRVCLYSGNQIFDSYLIRYHIGWNVHAYRDFY